MALYKSTPAKICNFCESKLYNLWKYQIKTKSRMKNRSQFDSKDKTINCVWHWKAVKLVKIQIIECSILTMPSIVVCLQGQKINVISGVRVATADANKKPSMYQTPYRTSFSLWRYNFFVCKTWNNAPMFLIIPHTMQSH